MALGPRETLSVSGPNPNPASSWALNAARYHISQLPHGDQTLQCHANVLGSTMYHVPGTWCTTHTDTILFLFLIWPINCIWPINQNQLLFCLFVGRGLFVFPPPRLFLVLPVYLCITVGRLLWVQAANTTASASAGCRRASPRLWSSKQQDEHYW